MDRLNSDFNRLSTSAREWTPTITTTQAPPRGTGTGSSDQSANTSVESDLNANAVKEFVPGKGWSVASSSGLQQASDAGVSGQENPYETPLHEKVEEADHEQEYLEVTLPAGPSPPPFRGMHSFGMSDDLWRWHRDVALESLRQMEPSDPRHKAIPPPYCNAYCLDDLHLHMQQQNKQSQSRSSFGYPYATFQVISREDGYLYCLRRFDSVKSVSHKIAATVLEQWAAIEHPSLATLHKCFLSQRAVFFVHQFIRGSVSVRDRFLLMGNQYLSENLLWSAICQLVTLIRRVHGARLALRTLDPKHVLVQMDSIRLKVIVNCPGIMDALEFEARKPLADLQMMDMRQLGYLILSMATSTEITASTNANILLNCEHFCSQNFSRDLHSLCMTLIRSPAPPSIAEVSRALAGRIMDEYDIAQVSMAQMERTLAAEYESGRMARLLFKLGFINERPEFGPNRRWAQSGDCYVLSLFRDYVFHQADGAGNPVMDLGHVITCLNKLDASAEEKIVLSSRDGKSLMVVTYADVARCLEGAYHELCSGSVRQLPARVGY
ncbi:unnamed protein product [Cylindrotheca closterium]|uniref:Pan3 C-terminal knob domain-containing protein n=1 Tax=Cylindrotheca closterium TaxID=2856 RepID=A0AAD2JKI0_9STRA|nr:unnamed protein product [Cylindrotheca closterium]